MKEARKPLSLSRQLLSWVKEGIVPLDEVLDEEDPTPGQDPSDSRQGLWEGLEDHQAVRRLRRYGEMSKERERRHHDHRKPTGL